MESWRSGPLQPPHRLTLRILDRDGHVAAGRSLKEVIDTRSVRRVLANRLVVVGHGRCGNGAEAVRRSDGKQVRGGVQILWRHLAERRDVVQNPGAAAVGADDEIVEVLLHDEPVRRRVRQVVLQRLPVLAIVERHVHAVLRPEIQEATLHGILAHAVRVAEHRMRDAVRNQLPRCAVISR